MGHYRGAQRRRRIYPTFPQSGTTSPHSNYVLGKPIQTPLFANIRFGHRHRSRANRNAYDVTSEGACSESGARDRTDPLNTLMIAPDTNTPHDTRTVFVPAISPPARNADPGTTLPTQGIGKSSSATARTSEHVTVESRPRTTPRDEPGVRAGDTLPVPFQQRAMRRPHPVPPSIRPRIGDKTDPLRGCANFSPVIATTYEEAGENPARSRHCDRGAIFGSQILTSPYLTVRGGSPRERALSPCVYAQHYQPFWSP